MKKSILFCFVFLGLLASGLHAQKSPPQINSVSPSQASPANDIVQVVISGANFTGVTSSGFSFSPPGISVTFDPKTDVGPNVVVADFNVCGAQPGAYNFTITSPAGTSNRASFTVTQSGPVISDTAPRSGAPGTTFPITILGCALQNTEAIFAQTTGVSFSNISSNGSQVTANMTLSPSTPGGQFALSVANPLGTSNSIFFDVIAGGAPPPSLTSLSPSSEPAGTTFTLQLIGSNLDNATSMNVSPNAGILPTISQNSTGQITALVAIPSSATPGNYVVTVTTPAGTSNGLIFAVTAGSGGGNNCDNSGCH